MLKYQLMQQVAWLVQLPHDTQVKMLTKYRYFPVYAMIFVATDNLETEFRFDMNGGML